MPVSYSTAMAPYTTACTAMCTMGLPKTSQSKGLPRGKKGKPVLQGREVQVFTFRLGTARS